MFLKLNNISAPIMRQFRFNKALTNSEMGIYESEMGIMY